MSSEPFDVDWSYLRTALTHFIAAAVVTAAVYGATAYLKDDAAAGKAEQEHELRAAREDYVQRVSWRRAWAEFGERFHTYQAHGLIGAENRLRWLEQLQAASRALELPSLRYVLAAQGVYQPPTRQAAAVTASEMSLQTALWHEGDLLALLDRLRNDAHELLWARACDLRRRENMETQAPVLLAECTLLWLTVSTAAGAADE